MKKLAPRPVRNRLRLDADAALDRVLAVFPKVYYFFTPIKPFEENVAPGKIKKLAKQLQLEEAEVQTIEIADPLDAILLLLETFEVDQAAKGKEGCSQKKLLSLISRWMPLSRGQFTKELNKLYATELITGRIDDSDRRERELRLTDKGREVLRKIKDQRKDIMKVLLLGRSELELKALVDDLEEIAMVTWQEMTKSS